MESKASLEADCPRCGIKNVTFRLEAFVHNYDLDISCIDYEVFSICRRCNKSTVFILGTGTNYGVSEDFLDIDKGGFVNDDVDFNGGYVSLSNYVAEKPPEHVPEHIKKIFIEGAICSSAECYNAAGTMFRLCLDLTAKGFLEKQGNPLKNTAPLDQKIDWLFKEEIISERLKRLSNCIREDGNGGAHDGDLIKADVERLIAFTTRVLTDIYTEPEEIRIAEEIQKKKKDSKTSDLIRS